MEVKSSEKCKLKNKKWERHGNEARVGKSGGQSSQAYKFEIT